MCNAKSQRKSREELNGLFRRSGIELTYEMPGFEPRYRIGPRQKHVVLFPDLEDGISAVMAQWDLVPPGNAKPFLRTNARSDALREKWPWKNLVQNNRCITPADGFFEPEKPALAKGSAPWRYYSLKDDGLFWMPGLFTRLTPGDDMLTYTIITTEANEAIHVHDRMPVMLGFEDALTWLQDDEPPMDLLRPYPAELMRSWRVRDEAKSSRAGDHPGLITPVEDAGRDLLL